MSKDDDKTPRKSVLIWVDCEMTGLTNDDELIEIAIVPTDTELNLLDSDTGIDLIIAPSENGMQLLRRNDYVYKMHKKSGLLPQLESAESLESVTQKCVDYVRQFLDDETDAYLSGNSVHVDKRFMDKYMDDLTSLLHYRIIDVSTVKLLSKFWYPEQIKELPKKKSNHRALDDILESIEELKTYREHFFLQIN